MKYNFGAGPGKLAKEVLAEAAEAVQNFNNTGLSILEISHRSEHFMQVLNETEQLVRDLLKVPDTHDVIFLQGGASTHFAMVPMNLLPSDGTAIYLDTGMWSSKAIAEAKKFGKVSVIASSVNADYNFYPKGFTVPKDAAYYHFTSNNTIFGTGTFETPQVDIPLVCDMSSDIFSRDIDVSDYSLIYAGAQKNTGPAGMTLVIIKKGILGRTGRDIPIIFDYGVHVANKSLYNTPAVYAIYVTMLNLRWLSTNGGVSAIEQENIRKAEVLYKEIDDNPLFSGTAKKEDRSRMNVTFVMNSKDLEYEFSTFASQRGIVGIAGHRHVGGFRASLYNAVDLKDVEFLVETMREYTRIKQY